MLHRLASRILQNRRSPLPQRIQTIEQLRQLRVVLTQLGLLLRGCLPVSVEQGRFTFRIGVGFGTDVGWRLRSRFT